MKALSSLPPSRRLPLLMALLVAVALLVSSVLGALVAHWESVDSQLAEVRNLADNGRKTFARTLKDVHADLRTLAGSTTVRAALIGLSRAFEDQGPQVRERLQQLYLQDNPNPKGQKQRLNDAGDGSDYSRLHAYLQPWLTNFTEDRGYYDLFLIDPAGKILYTVFKESDFASRLDSPALADSGLAAVYKRAQQLTDTGHYVFADFAPYAPSNGDPAAFIGVPVRSGGSGGRLLGVLVLQLPIEKFNDTLATLGSEGKRVFAEYGRSAAGVIVDDFVHETDAEGRGVRRIRLPVEIDGVRWYVVGEVHDATLYRPGLILGATLLAMAMLAVAVAVPLARRLVRSLWTPVEALASRFDAEVGRSVEEIGGIASQVEIISGRLAHEATDSGNHIRRLLERIDTVSASVGTAAVAVEQISVSIGNINSATGTSELRMSHARERVQAAEAAIGELLGATAEIDKVLRVIEGVAAQTRLLSLNAVIESARAGEYGKGFAVVANEVKALSHQTSGATKEVGGEVEAIRAGSAHSAEGLQGVASAVDQVGEAVRDITGMIGEQRMAVTEIAGMVGAVSGEAQAVAREARDVGASAERTGEEARSMRELAGRLLGDVERTRSRTQAFLAGLRAL